MLLVKKYPNRRLYDTRSSRYITLNDLEKTIRAGEDVTIQDAQDGRDLTQEPLTQLILERSGGRILPATLLLRLIRLDDAALGEFFTRYVGWALDMYVQAKDRARALLPLNPLATAPFAATDALARLLMGAAQWGRGGGDPNAQPMPAPFSPEAGPPVDAVDMQAIPPMPMPIPEPRPSSPSAASEISDEMLRLRREIDALKESMGAAPAARARPKKKAAKRSAKRG
jgi:polyhydroxyalkanoate synthesis repressor PhaR